MMHKVFGYPDMVRFSWSTTPKEMTRQGAHVFEWEAGSVCVHVYVYVYVCVRARTWGGRPLQRCKDTSEVARL